MSPSCCLLSSAHFLMWSRWWLNVKEVYSMPTWMCFVFGDCRGQDKWHSNRPVPMLQWPRGLIAVLTRRGIYSGLLDRQTHSISYTHSSVLLLPLHVHSKEAQIKGSLQMAASPHSTVWDTHAAADNPVGWRQLELSLTVRCYGFSPVSVPK